jgi:hypothetical protein
MHIEYTKCCKSCKEKSKRRYELKREDILKQQKEDRTENPDKYKQRSDVYRTKNRVQINIKQNERYARDTTKKEMQKAYNNSREGKYKSFVLSVNKGKYDISMTKDEIMNMTDMPCVYCGHETEDKVYRNGIDRLDSFIGYQIDNCVPCCRECNFMKGQVDPRTFIERVRQISMHNGGVGELTKNWSLSSKEWFGRYKNRMIRRGIFFNLTKEEFENLRDKNCHYCGRPSTTTHSNGIDRINCNYDIGYIISNCVPCCCDCNFMKRSLSVDDFIDRIMKISMCDYVFPCVTRTLSTFSRRNCTVKT